MIARLTACAALVAAVAGCPSGGGKRDPEIPNTNNTAPVTLVPGTLEDLKGEILDLEVAGLGADRTRAAKAALVSKVGGQFATADAAADIAALWALGGVADVKVEGRLVGRGVGLRYTVTDRPTITGVSMVGVSAFAADELIEGLPFRKGGPADPAAYGEAQRDLVDKYKERGFAKVEVTWSTKHADAGDELVFTVVEGPPIVVSAIEFHGNKAVKAKDLIAVVGKDGGPSVGGRFWDLALERAILYVTSHYYDRGYIQVQVKAPLLTPSADGASVALALDISEGPQFKLGKVAVVGTLIASQAEYTKLLGIKTGQVFNRTKLAEGIERIKELHRTRGNPGVEAFPTTQIDEKHKKIAITVEVSQPRQPAP